MEACWENDHHSVAKPQNCLAIMGVVCPVAHHGTLLQRLLQTGDSACLPYEVLEVWKVDSLLYLGPSELGSICSGFATNEHTRDLYVYVYYYLI